MADKIRFESDALTPALVEKAAKELRETPEVKEQALAKLREILKGDPTLKYKDDDETLLIYLRPTKFYPESAHALMKKCAEFREKHKDILAGLMPEDEKVTLMEHDAINVLADRDQDGRRILLLHVGSKWDPKKVTPDQVFRVLYLLAQSAGWEPQTQVNGVVVILDFNDLSMKQVTALTPSVSKRLLSFIQEALPLRLKEVHIVNQPTIFSIIWNVFKPFIGEKLKKRIYFHGHKMEDLHKHMNPNNLPADYGGKLPKVNYTTASWYPVLKSLDAKIAENNKQGLVKK